MTAPDDTAKFTLDGRGNDDAAHKALMQGTGTLRVHADHLFVTCCPGHGLVVFDATANDYTTHWRDAQWVLLRAVDISALIALKAFWYLRPAFLSQVAMDLQATGGLTLRAHKSVGTFLEAVVKASSTMPKIKATQADIIVADAPATGTWLDDLYTFSLV